MSDAFALAQPSPGNSSKALVNGDRVNSRFINWIWTINGSLALDPGQTSDDAFDRLDPLFRQYGTSHERTRDTLTFRKKDQPAQDKMSVFDSGVLWIEKGAAGSVLHYRMASRALLFCFLVPLLFLAFAGLTVTIGKSGNSSAQAGAASDASKKSEEKDVELVQNPIDKFLGAPAPEKPKKEGAGKDKKRSPTSAYVFAALFALLYVGGRFLEARLVKTLFKKTLLSSQPHLSHLTA